MFSDLRELWHYRELLLILVQRDLKVRYKNSFLGFGWSLVNPLVQVLVITLVIKVMMRAQMENYHLYVFCATLPWLFFSTALMDSSLSLIVYYNLLRRTYFPREIIPLAAIAANLIHLVLATAVFLVYSVALGLFWWAMGLGLDIAIQPSVLLIPIPMLGLLFLTTGVAFVLAVWTLYFEDMRFLLDSALKVLYWLVPVLYYPEILLHGDAPARGSLLYNLYMLNPLASFITTFKKLTLPPAQMPGMEAATSPMTAAEWGFLGIAFLVSLAVLAGGYRYFVSRKWYLAERG